MTFKKINENKINNELTILEFIHQKTGARHTHAIVEGTENAFSIVFRTNSDNDRGIPHILEHIVLEGSKKYPINNMFYKLSGKNFETVLNAGTYTDFTEYHFASNIEQGFLNLADVYLDSTLNPLISEASFLQEGFRYELSPEKDMKFSGVVYNEMMAWVGKKEMQIHSQMKKNLIGNHPLSSYSGGDPYEIADNKYEDILAFHKKNYHPSNSHTFTTGSIEVGKIHEKLDEFFDKFERLEIQPQLPIKFKNSDYVIEKMTHTGDDVISVHMTIKAGKVTPTNMARIDFLNRLAQVKISDYFTKRDQGVLLSAIGTMSFQDELVIYAEFQLKDEKRIETLFQEWSFAWEMVVESGIEKAITDSYFEGRLASYDAEKEGKYAEKINGGLMYRTMTGIKNNQESLKREFLIEMQEFFSEEKNIVELINEKYLHKERALVVYSTLDEKYVEKYMLEIAKKEQLRQENIDPVEREKITARLTTLREEEKLLPKSMQELPEVKIDSSFSAESLAQTITHTATLIKENNCSIKINDFNDNDVRARVSLRYNVVTENEEEVFFEILQGAFIEYTSFKGMSREETNVWREEGVKSLDQTIIMEKVGDETVLVSKVIGIGYKDKLETLIEKTSQLLTIQDFSNSDDFEQFLDIILMDIEDYAMDALHNQTAQFSLANNQNLRFTYLDEIAIIPFMKKMAEDMGNGNYDTFNRFVNYYNSDKRKNAGVWSVIIDASKSQEINIINKLRDLKILGEAKHLTLEKLLSFTNVNLDLSKNVALICETPSAFTSSTVLGMPTKENKKDFIQMNIISKYLSEVAIQTLRVKMGAYGAWVRCVNGGLVFFTYRTPMPLESIAYYEGLIKEVLSAEIDMEIFEKSKREVLAQYVTYQSKRSIAQSLESVELQGKNYSFERADSINLIIEMNAHEIKPWINKYFNDQTKYFHCVATNAAKLESKLNGWQEVVYPLQ